MRAVRDYRSGLRTQDGESRPMGLPASDVLYYELEGGSWFCVRPSGTEPKIKLYVNAFADAQPQADALADAIGRAAQELLA